MNIVTVASSNAEFRRHSEGDVIELVDGRLLLVYMEFSGNGEDDAPTRLVAVESADGGLTWGRHRVLVTTQADELNVYSPNLIRGQDGRILLVFMRQFEHAPRRTTHFLWASSDEGDSFTPVSTFAERAPYSLCNGVIKRSSSGRLLIPQCVSNDDSDNAYTNSYGGTVLYSDDDGMTWATAETEIRLPMRGVMEPHLEETRDGRLHMVMRNQLGSVFMSTSANDGVTWSKPQVSALRAPESCPEITQIPETGDLLLIWNNSEYDPGFRSHFGKRSPLTAAVSKDEGRTWEHIRDIEPDPSRAFSNPGCRFTRDGRAVVNYWTCEYTENWAMQNDIDLRVAIIPTAWFYES